MERLQKISRKLSKILRHDPYPLSLDKDGWMSCDSILNHYDITMDDLIWIVDNNDKKRFSFNDDETLIRANQGHSAGLIENILPQITMVQQDFLLYHGTDLKTADLILADCIKPGKREHVHWTKNKDLATKRAKQRQEWNKDKPVLITLSVKKYLNNKGKLYISENDVYLTPEISNIFLNKIEL